MDADTARGRERGRERSAPQALPVPPAPEDGITAAVDWVRTHLGDLVGDVPGARIPSERFRGGQGAADAALARLDLTGYADARSEVLPETARGATGLSPYVRHGLLTLPALWRAAADAPARDRERFRDELLWQEYARHLYARLGDRTRSGLRHEPVHVASAAAQDPWERARAVGMACLSVVLDELDRDGWLVNQTRMWVASHWSVRGGADWREGEDRLYRELLDGSRAANRLGWQWTVGAGTGRPYGFSRQQVERRAPGLCDRCPLVASCPISGWPEDPTLLPVDADPRLRRDPDTEATAGPATTVRAPGPPPEGVWLTAESLGDDDPALAAHPDLPAVFVFDVPLLARLRLHPRRLVFLAETLGDLATRRGVEVWRGDPIAVIGTGGPAGRTFATTFTPVPGWRRRVRSVTVGATHPWPWLRRPDGERLTSFSAWRGRD